MRAEDIIPLLRAQPFEPFVIHMSDGKKYRIHHRSMALVQPSRVIVGVPSRKDPDGPLDHSVTCSLVDVVRVEQ